MKLFIMRHGEAEARAASDSQRELTPEGRSDVAQMMTSYAQELSAVDMIWASPYTRAQQTASIVGRLLSKPVITQEFLPPNGHPNDVLAALESNAEQTILLVSHQPLVGVLVDQLAGLEPGRYRMGTASLAYLRSDVYANGCAELKWLHQPASIQPVPVVSEP